MADYYTGICDFNDEEWDAVDRDSRIEMIDLLSTIGATSIAESHGKCSWDISCDMNGNNFVFELKDRDLDSTDFGDIMVEKDKYDNNVHYCPGFTIVAVNFFKDGIIAMCRMDGSTMRCSYKLCNATTKLRGCSREKVRKLCATMKQKIKYTKNSIGWKKI